MLLQEIYREREQIAEPVRDAIRRCWAGESDWPLVLSGDAGSGKTCAALCMIDHYGGMYWMAGQWVGRIRDAMMGRATWSSGYAATELELWRQWSGARLCVLDELGSRSKVSDHHYETIKRCIDDLIDALIGGEDGVNEDLRVGIHVQGFDGGGSESFIGVPDPATGLLLATATGLLGIARRRRTRTAQ